MYAALCCPLLRTKPPTSPPNTTPQVAVGVLLKTLTETGGTHAMAVALVALVCLYVAGFAWSW